MSNTSKSILIFGIYIIGVGLSLIFVPNIILSILGLPVPTEVWVRVLGALAAVLGLYYVQAARENDTKFYRMTVWGRVLFMLSLTVLGLVTPGHIMLILFGAVDLAGAIWTWVTMRSDK